MENLNLIIGIAVTILNLILLVYPDISKNLKIKICISSILIGGAIIFFTSNSYKHWKYYDEKKLSVKCQQLSPIITDDDNFYYMYMVVISNLYPEGFKIEDVEFEFQSRLFINNCDIVLSDIPHSSINSSVKGNSIYAIKIEKFEGKQFLAASIDCVLPKEHSLEIHGATLDWSYKLFGKKHQKSSYVNISGIFPLSMPLKEAVVFDLYEVLDNRKLPEFFFTYHYFKKTDESGQRTIEVYCSDSEKKYLRVKYKYPNGEKILESERAIHNDIDPIRILILKDNSITIQSWLGHFREENASTAFKAGIEFAENKKYQEAANSFKKVTDIDPRDYEAWFNFGLALELSENFNAAIEAFQKAIGLKGDYYKAYYEMGNVQLKMNNESDAEISLKKAIELNPRYALAYFRLGCMQKTMGNYDEARSNLSLAVKYETDKSRLELYKKCYGELESIESAME